MDHMEEQMEYRRGQGNVTKNADSFEEKAVDREGSETPRYPPIMVTVRVRIDMEDRDNRGNKPEYKVMHNQQWPAKG